MLNGMCSAGNATLTAKVAACDVIHATDGWMYIRFPDEEKTGGVRQCCKCSGPSVPGSGYILLDWPQKPETQYMGTEMVNGMSARC